MAFAPSPFDSATGSQNGPTRATSYSPTDGPPPHAAPRPAGADTTALLGAQQDDSAGAMSPKARVLAACAMLQQAANILATDAPMVLQMVPTFISEIQQISATAPEMMDELSRMPNPLAMFSAIGSSALSGGPGGGSGPQSGPIATNPATAAGVPSRQAPPM